MGKATFIRTSVISRSLQVLPTSDRKRVPLVFVAQVFLSLMDLLGVAIIGVVGALAVNGIKSGIPGERVGSVLRFLGLEGYSLQTQVTLLGISAAAVLVLKTVVSAVLVRKITYYLSRRAALISSELTHKLLSANPQMINRKSPQENLYALTNGVVAIAIGIIAAGITLFADLILLLVLFSGLIILDYRMALLTFAIFGLTSLLLYKYMHRKARIFGQLSAETSIASSETILEAIYSFREIFVRDQRGYYIEKITKQRLKFAEVSSVLANMPNLSKYAIEITLVAGAILLSALQFLTQDAVRAVAILSVFLAASSRIAPAVLRIQQGAIQIRSQSGVAETAFTLMRELSQVEPIFIRTRAPNFEHIGFTPQIHLQNISFRYDSSETKILENISMEVHEGEMISIVGPSGAGKSTLVDVILGILMPSKGTVEISGMRPYEAIREWPGAMSYLPQDVVLSRGTIHSNITLGSEAFEINDKYLSNAIQAAQIGPLIDSLPTGIFSDVSDRGENFSGGQRQRIGIARALYSNPKLLVLDEATSALDGDTESEFTQALKELKGKVTIIMIAHRLSSVLESDRIYYMENGEIKGSGTFTELKMSLPNFARQAERMGL